MDRIPDSIDAKVRKWLLDTGYPLEMRVIRAFAELDEARHTTLHANSHYVDPTSMQSREVDLIVSWVKPYNNANFLVTLVVECKNTKEPWVIFKRNSDEPLEGALFDPSYAHLQKDTPGAESKAFFARLELEGLLVDYLPAGLKVSIDGYAIVTAFKDRNSRDPADSAVRQVLSAAKNAGLPVEPEFGMHTWYCYSVPVIVTTSPLYEASLDDEGHAVDLRAVNVSSVTQPMPDGTGLDSVAVTIFHESALSELLAHCRHLQDVFVDLNGDVSNANSTEDGKYESGNEEDCRENTADEGETQ